ncbi:MAG TPA: MFS transporter [Motilibacteraceae bacterium]|nr:MFS transporter [Motilibacteraceae bacterium]
MSGPLRSREAMVLLTASAVSAAGSGLSTTGMLLALSAPGIPPRVLAFVSIGWLLGTLLGSAVAGRTTDSARSLPRRAAGTDLGAAAVSALAALGGARTPWTLALVGGSVLVFTAVGANARQVLAARWFGSDVGRFSGLSSALSGATAAMGGGLSALLVHQGRSLATLFAVDAVTFGVAALLRALLPDDGVRPAVRSACPQPRRLLPRLGVLALPGVAALVAVFCLAQLAEAVAARLFVPVVLTVFAAPAGWVPLLEAVGVVGALAGAMLVPPARRLLPRPHRLLAATLPGLAAAVAGYGLVRAVLSLVPLEALVAVLGTVAGAALIEALRLAVPPERRGQAFAALLTAGTLAQAGALAVLGMAADRLGLRTTLALGGVPLLAAVPLALRAERALSPARSMPGPTPVDDLASPA